MGDFTTMLLYAVPIIYLDCMRFERDAVSIRNTDTLRMALEVLQHFDHPAGDICEVCVPTALAIALRPNYKPLIYLLPFFLPASYGAIFYLPPNPRFHDADSKTLGYDPRPFRQLSSASRLVQYAYALTHYEAPIKQQRASVLAHRSI